jgi:hypothetical protein
VNEAAEEFRRLAARYCEVVERAVGRDRLGLQEALMELLPALYSAGSALPNVEPATEDLLPDRPTNDEWFAVFKGLQEVLGPSDLYRSVQPYPIESKEEPGLGSVADDLGDTWRELKQGLLALEAGVAEADVVFHWREGYASHWGYHAADALAAIHKFYW